MRHGRLPAIVVALVAGCTLTTHLDELGAGSTTSGAGGATGAGGGVGGGLGGGSVTLSAEAHNHHRIELTWASESETVDVERNNEIIRTAVSGTSFQDQGLEPETQYTYRIRAGAAWSPPASATTSEEPPGDYSEQVIADEPRAYFRLENEGSQSLIDTMGNVSAGTNEGAAFGTGKFGDALSFDGVDDHADLETIHTPDSDWGWSWELWVYIVEYPGEESGLLGCTNTPRWTLDTTGSVLAGMSRRDGTGFVGWNTETIVPVFVWQHLVLTVEGAITNAPVLKFYIAGSLAAEQHLRTPLHSPWSKSGEGMTDEGDLKLNIRDMYSRVVGLYDEAAAYDYVLSSAQVARHFAIGSLAP
jgi:hypothetical protein